MNKKQIKSLLEKYYKAETSEEEELRLRRFFSDEDVPSEFLNEKEIFSYYHDLSEIADPPEDFADRIIAAAFTEELKSGRSGNRRIFLTITGIAAGLLILTGSYFFFLRKSEPIDTFTDPQIAYAETMKILYNVSVRMNQAAQALEPVARMQEIAVKSLDEIQKPEKIIEEKLKPLNKFNKAVEVVGDISMKSGNGNPK